MTVLLFTIHFYPTIYNYNEWSEQMVIKGIKRKSSLQNFNSLDLLHPISTSMILIIDARANNGENSPC